LGKLQFSTGSDAKRKFDFRPTKYNFTKFTPLRFCWYLNHNTAWLVASHILKGDVKVAVFFCSQINYATRKSYHLFSIPVRSDCIVIAASGPGQLNSAATSLPIRAR
jgi:hypothetical protein